MKIKKMICVLLSIILIPLGDEMVFASESEGVVPVEYINFNDTNLSRMSSDGTFDFMFVRRVQSDTFVANSNTVTIVTEAYIARAVGGSGYSYTCDNNVSFKMTLKKSNGTVVGSYTGYCNGIRGGYTFNVASGNRYYIELSTQEPDLAGVGKWIAGNGSVSNVTVNN